MVSVTVCVMGVPVGEEVNSLIEQLQTADSVTLAALKGLYRSLALRLHPDVTKSSGKDFVKLQEEYEEALELLLSKQGEPSETSVKRSQRAADSRSEFLRSLYFFSIHYYGRHWRRLVPELIQLASCYDPTVGRVVSDYVKAFLQGGTSEDLNGPAAEANDILLTTVKRIACYYENGLVHNKHLIESYLRELDQRLKHLNLAQCQCLGDMTALFMQELKGQRVSLMTL